MAMAGCASRPPVNGAGSLTTDLIEGTLLIDNARVGRYWSPTFCSVCAPPEKRDNEDILVKGNYFLSTGGTGSHSLVFGYDTFNDVRTAKNHQSGSDYRILGTSTIIQGCCGKYAYTPKRAA